MVGILEERSIPLTRQWRRSTSSLGLCNPRWDWLCESSFGLRHNFIHRLIVGVNLPLLHQVVFYDHQPRGRYSPFIFRRKFAVCRDRAARGTEYSYGVAMRQDLFVSNPVIRTERKISLPRRGGALLNLHISRMITAMLA
jgi:hypothetical protein